MGSDSEFSSGGSEHDDSDTIVISSKSRILISPRKKGSKAVSKLLGTAADDVVEQLLRGAEGQTKIVSKTKHSAVRVNNQDYVVRDGECRSDVRSKATSSHGNRSQRVGREATQLHQTTTKTSQRRVNQQSVSSSSHTLPRQPPAGDCAIDHESEYSDLGSGELSAPSSDEGERAVTHQRTSTGGPTGQHHQSLNRPRHGSHEEHNGDYISPAGEEEESDASGSTKESSLSQRERDIRSAGQRKFDDQLQVGTKSSHHTTIRTHRNDAKSEEATDTRVGKPVTKRNHARKRVEDSDLDDSVILPTSATQEMEDLKQTLKNLAHQDPLMSASSISNGANTTFLLSNPPKKSASFSGNSRGVGQIRKQEYVGSLQNGYDEAAWSATSSALTRSEEATVSKASKHSSRRRARDPGTDEDFSDSDHSETPIARRLFSTPPPRAASKMSTPPTVPASFGSRRTPSPQRSALPTSNSMLDTSLTASGTSSAQGSRAVLSALKALQDKIRRLEEEREKLMQELSDVKVKARKREAEFASAEKKFTYELGQTKESARAAYDAIRSEREELKLELVKHEERKKAMAAELQHAHKLSSTFSAKADDLQSQLHASESQRARQQAETEAMRGAHNQEVRDLKAEMLALQKEKEASQEQAKLLQVQFERESQNHAETRERLHEAEQTVAGITQLNDKLVAKVWEANEIATKATKKTKKLQQSQKVSTLSRPTAASRAASISGPNNSGTPGRSASMKKTRTGSVTTKSSASTKKEKRGSQQLGNNNLELLRAANLGRDIPFVLGTSANRSHSIISNVQEAIRQCDTTYAVPVTNPPPTPTFLKARKNTAKLRKASAGGTDQASIISRTGTSASILGIEGSDPAATLVASRTKANTANGSASDMAESAKSKRPSAIRVPTPSTSYPNPIKSQIMEDLQAAVESAEAEFSALNRKYKDAVAKVESGRDGAAQLATALDSMLDGLESKGKQLNLLKQVYEQASHSTINPIRHIVHSPEAVRRKTASLRILNDYRQMERDAKSPRSAAVTPGSPTHTNATSRRASFFSDD